MTLWGNFFLEKNSHDAETKLKGGTLWDFSTSILSPSIQKNEGGPFEEEKKFAREVSQCQKNCKGDSLASPGNNSRVSLHEEPTKKRQN